MLQRQMTQPFLGWQATGEAFKMLMHDGRPCMQGDTTKLKEYMKTLNLLPHKRKRKDAMLVKSPFRSPRLSPRSCLTGAAPSTSKFTFLIFFLVMMRWPHSNQVNTTINIQWCTQPCKLPVSSGPETCALGSVQLLHREALTGQIMPACPRLHLNLCTATGQWSAEAQVSTGRCRHGRHPQKKKKMRHCCCRATLWIGGADAMQPWRQEAEAQRQRRGRHCRCGRLCHRL